MRLMKVMIGLAILAAGCPQSIAAETPAATQVAKKFEFQQSRQQEVNYLLFLPSGYAEKGARKWPLILFLHGAGERGTDVQLVAKHGPPKIAPQRPGFEFIVVSPQCPDNQVWDPDVVLALLDKVISEHAVDTNRVYLTGLSMGGYGTWDLGIRHPERFAAIAPICGGGETISILLSSRPAALKKLAIWAFHGAKDNVVSPKESERMVEMLKRFGLPEVKLTVYPEAGHDAWTETYNNPEFYQWLLSHQL